MFKKLIINRLVPGLFILVTLQMIGISFFCDRSFAQNKDKLTAEEFTAALKEAGPKLSPVQVIDIVENKTSGRVVSLRIRYVGEKLGYGLIVLLGGTNPVSLQALNVDGDTGDILLSENIPYFPLVVTHIK